jgi:hypothetical protein
VSALAELGLSRLGGIPGLSAVGAAAILAETGDPRRYDGSSSLVKHAGLSPAGNASGAFSGQARLSRRGRPALRLAVWRAVWPMLRYYPVMAAMCQALSCAVGPPAAAAGPLPGAPGAGRSPRPARQGPRRVRRLPAALDLLHGRPRHRLGSRRRLRRRQLPRRPAEPGGGRLTSASCRHHPARVP